MRVDAFDFELPPELIAQEAAPRGQSRLLVLDSTRDQLSHSSVRELPRILAPGDLLVANDTRVFPARLLGHRVPSGGSVECLLLHRRRRRRPRPAAETWHALMHPGQKLKPGARVIFERDGRTLHGEVLERLFFGRRRIRLHADTVPLPTPSTPSATSRCRPTSSGPIAPLIATATRRSLPRARLGGRADRRSALHAAAARGARGRGVERTAITLHVGYGTFKPVRVDDVEEHIVDPERYDIVARAPRRRSTRLSTRAAASSRSARRRRARSKRSRARASERRGVGGRPAGRDAISSSTRDSSSASSVA